MNQFLRQNKQVIRQYLRDAYTDENLVALLAHTRDGKLHYESCCCLAGIPTADHALRGQQWPIFNTHYQNARPRPANFSEADHAYFQLSDGYSADSEDHRRRRLIPIILAELKRRARIRQVTSEHMGHESYQSEFRSSST